MDTITCSAARANLARTMEEVCQDHEPPSITRSGQKTVVMLSLDDFKSLEETAYLLRSPENARRLLSTVTACKRDPFQGIGKPEPLKHALAGFWSRRINEEHRMVYHPQKDGLLIAPLRYRY
jgi:antitoxin YefM